METDSRGRDREKHREYNRAWRAANRERVRDQARAWKQANPEKVREHQRAWKARHLEQIREQRRAYYLRNKEQSRERARAYKQADPEKVREQQRMSSRKWRRTHREIARRRENRRETRKAGVLLVVEVQADHCGVCQRPLTSLPYPDPMSTTVGHEPPLAVACRDGWLIVATRPEHWGCNMRKSDRMDVDL